MGRASLRSVVDPFGSVAPGFPHTTKTPDVAVAVLVNEVLPFYQDRAIPLAATLTDNDREFNRTETHPDELLLTFAEIEFGKATVEHSWTSGFVERFHRTILDELFRLAFRTPWYESVEVVTVERDRWLAAYTTERPHLGSRNHGRRPMNNVDNHLANRVAA